MVKEDLREFKQTVGHLYQFVVKFVRALPCTLHCGLCKTGKALTNSIWLDKLGYVTFILTPVILVTLN